MLAKTKMGLKALGMRFAALGPVAHTLILKLVDVAMHLVGGPCTGH